MKKLQAIFTFSALTLTLFVSGVYARDTKDAPTVEQQVYKRIVNVPRYSVFDFISYEVKGDTVVLSGKVYSIGTTSDVVDEVKKVPGIAHVVNKIEQLPASSFDDQIRLSLLRQFERGGLGRYLSEIRPDIRIIVENGRVTLEGFVSNKADSDRANIYANGVNGVFNIQNNLVVGKRTS
jgi:hyperosmotically inducible protein